MELRKIKKVLSPYLAYYSRLMSLAAMPSLVLRLYSFLSESLQQKFRYFYKLILRIKLIFPQAAQLSTFYIGKSVVLHLHEGPD